MAIFCFVFDFQIFSCKYLDIFDLLKTYIFISDFSKFWIFVPLKQRKISMKVLKKKRKFQKIYIQTFLTF